MHSRLELSLGVLAAALCLVTHPSQAGIFSNNAFADAFVTTGPTGNLSGSNYGGAGALSVAAPGLANGQFQSVLGFNTAAAFSSFNTQYGAGQWTILSVTLQLTATPNNNAIFDPTASGLFGVSLMQNNGWTEGTGTPINPTTDGITYNSLQGTYINNGADQALGSFNFNGASSGTALYSLGLTPGLLTDIEDGGILSLRLFAEDSSLSYLFNSRTGGSGTSHPELIIAVVPEPGTIALSAMGLAIVACCRRSRRN
jgi:hypothetical protein